MNDSIYIAAAEELCRIGGINAVGVVTEAGKTAISYAGNKPLAKYFDGTQKLSLIFNISGMGINDNQDVLIKKLCSIGEELRRADISINGLTNPKVKINSPPIPTTHNEHYWIYTTGIELQCYYKEVK